MKIKVKTTVGDLCFGVVFFLSKITAFLNRDVGQIQNALPLQNY